MVAFLNKSRTCAFFHFQAYIAVVVYQVHIVFALDLAKASFGEGRHACGYEGVLRARGEMSRVVIPSAA